MTRESLPFRPDDAVPPLHQSPNHQQQQQQQPQRTKPTPKLPFSQGLYIIIIISFTWPLFEYHQRQNTQTSPATFVRVERKTK